MPPGKIFDFVVPPFVGDSRDVLLFWDYDDGMQFTTDAFTHQYVYRDAGNNTFPKIYIDLAF